jgi:thiol:disulfide interchange protein/DsbC/DsbD-like thiol-disulfide interchange protein
MRRLTAMICGLAVLLLSGAAPAQIGEKRPLVRAALVAEHAAVRPGEKITVAVRQTITPGWHTYWKNPGDSGEATAIEWKLPEGVTATALEWPLPEAIPFGPLTNYGYSDQLLLLTDITVPQGLTGPSLTLSANVRWLVCKDICVPEETSVSLTLPVIDAGLSPRSTPDAAVIAATRKALPQAAPWPVRYESAGKSVVLKIDALGAEQGATEARFFPLSWGQVANAAEQKASFSGGGLSLRMEKGEAGLEGAAPLEGVLALDSTGPDGAKLRRGYVVSAQAAPASASTLAAASETASADLGLGLALLFAFLGGLILNLMPCVFPVLSLKAYGLAQGVAEKRRVGGLAYLAGVLASFGLIAAGLMALRSAGVAAGWGIQFQSPGFLLALIALFLALGLNMSGVFEIGGSLTGAGDGLARREGLAGSFFTGVLATVVATPCTAPFMGAAVGYAFSQPPAGAIAVLMALGLGFAMPIVLLSMTPGLGRLLPRPGTWMVRFKQVMAFPLYATAAWLVWVLSVQQGSDGVMAAMITLVVVGFAAWLIGLGGRSALRTGIAAAIAALGIAASAAVLPDTPQTGAAQSASTSGPSAEAFTQARLDQLIAEGKPVFVNFTAAWCITCKVNERVALNSERMAGVFKERGITYLKGDWTSANPEISAVLQSFGRAGVPLYLLYSGKPGSQPQVLPQLLTESIILGHIAELSSPPVKQAKGEL